MVTTTSPTPHATTDLPTVRRLTAVFLVLHGIAHLVGAQAAVDAAGASSTVPHLFGLWEAGGPALPVLAVGWVAAAAGFVVAALWMWARRPHWWEAAVAVTILSLVLSLLALPQAVAGVVIDLVLLAAAMVVRRAAIDDVAW